MPHAQEFQPAYPDHQSQTITPPGQASPLTLGLHTCIHPQILQRLYVLPAPFTFVYLNLSPAD